MYSKRALVAILGLLVGIVEGGAVHAQTVSQVAKVHKRPEGAPQLSDVSMRLFRKKENQAELTAARAFHITRADWSYIKDPEYIKKIHDFGWTFQGTLNAVTHNPEHAKRNKNGEPMLDHFNKPGRYWADNDNESYRQWYLNEMLEWVEVGADSIQRDEPTTCYRTPIADAARFFKEMHAAFNEKVDRDVPLSCNLAWNGSVFGGKGKPLTQQFDFGVAEMGPDKVRPDFLWNAAMNTLKRGKAMMYTAHRKFTVPSYRRSIAGCYANGMHFIVPWDQYAGIGEPRVFSRPEDLADLYGFVRANAPHLDGYADAAAVGYRLKDPRWQDDPPLRLDGADRVTAFVRAKPGDAHAPVVIHLIDWNKPEEFRLRLRRSAFFPGDELVFRLKTPRPYDKELHEKAEKSNEYSLLSCDTLPPSRGEGDWVTVEIPELKPWGLLIVARDTLLSRTNKDSSE
jgi:hypothetical protein